jgi:hypothetical protein
MGVTLRKGEVTAEGDLDFRGTLGVDRQAAVGFTDIRQKLTERYCAVLQTLAGDRSESRASIGLAKPGPIGSRADHWMRISMSDGASRRRARSTAAPPIA